MTITTEWGEEDYTFSVAVPVSAASFTLNGQTYAIETPVPNQSDEGQTEDGQPKVYAPGEKDAKGMFSKGFGSHVPTGASEPATSTPPAAFTAANGYTCVA